MAQTMYAHMNKLIKKIRKPYETVKKMMWYYLKDRKIDKCNTGERS
jgi:hypothetical protein